MTNDIIHTIKINQAIIHTIYSIIDLVILTYCRVLTEALCCNSIPQQDLQSYTRAIHSPNFDILQSSMGTPRQYPKTFHRFRHQDHNDNDHKELRLAAAAVTINNDTHF